MNPTTYYVPAYLYEVFEYTGKNGKDFKKLVEHRQTLDSEAVSVRLGGGWMKIIGAADVQTVRKGDKIVYDEYNNYIVYTSDEFDLGFVKATPPIVRSIIKARKVLTDGELDL